MTIAIAAAFLAVTLLHALLEYVNLSHLAARGRTVPAEFADTVDPARLARIADYTTARTRLGLVEAFFDAAVVLVFFFGGLLAAYDRLIAGLGLSFLWQGVVFVLVLQAAQTIIGIPFSLIMNFRIEKNYGFNTMTLRLWAADLVKSTVIAALLMTIVVVTALWILQASPEWWWLWVWAFLALFGVLLMYLSPVVIEPLFFKFEPLAPGPLEERIRELAGRAGIQVSRVLRVDASRRSRHSNAYFTGIGKVKRIVLFDTLLAQMTDGEILAVLAHEMGHWKKKHVLKRLALAEATAFGGLLLASRLLPGDVLPSLLGLGGLSFFAKVAILSFLASLAAAPLAPFFNGLSRRDERAADDFAVALTGGGADMASALVTLARENLANLHPHPLYAWFHYSHPPVLERIRRLRAGSVQ